MFLDMYPEMEKIPGPLLGRATGNIRVFTPAQIQCLIRGYAPGQIITWGQDEVFQDVLGRQPSDESAILALTWDISELLGHLVCVVNPGSAQAWILRIILGPEFIWLGLHPAGTLVCNAPGDGFFGTLLGAIRLCPLAGSAMMQRQMQVDQQWLELLSTLDDHLRTPQGSIEVLPLPLVSDEPDPMDHSRRRRVLAFTLRMTPGEDTWACHVNGSASPYRRLRRVESDRSRYKL